MKKLLVALLTVAMALVLTACGGGKSGGDAKKADAKFPSHGIKMICPWKAGGAADIAIRNLTPYLEKDLGVKITVVNTTGANGWIAWGELLKAPADGYTIAQMNVPSVYSYLDPKQNRKENLDSFIFLANEISDWGCLVVNGKDDRFKDLQSFVEYGKANELLSGDAGLGSNQHLVAIDMERKLGLKIKHVHQAGWADVHSSLLGRHLDVGWGSIGNILQAYKSGELKVLCVFADKRSSLLPNVPTFNELMKDKSILSPSDRGFALKAGTDKAIVDRWNQAMNKCINNPEFVKKMESLGQPVNYMDMAKFTSYAKEQEASMKSVMDVLGWKKK